MKQYLHTIIISVAPLRGLYITSHADALCHLWLYRLQRMSIYEKRLKCALNKVARRLELKSFRFEYCDVDTTCENYFGVLVPMTLIEETDNGAVHRKLLAKMPQNSKELRDAGVFEYLYEVESFFYLTLLPLYKRLSRINLEGSFAECYYADMTHLEEVIILKDMREDGFRRYEGDRFLDFDHVVVSLQSLALFHALSMILRNKTGTMDTKQLLKPYLSNYPTGFMNALRGSLNNNLHIFKDTKHETFFNKLAANINDIINGCINNAKYLVYGHGDFWKENIMYKYEDNKPKSACILDFQTIRLLSPAQDVLCFLLTNTKSEMRRQYYDFLLETYYSRLQSILLDHSVEPDIVYSRKDFVSDLKTVSSYCFLIANMSFSLWLGLEKVQLLKSKHISDDESEDRAAIEFYKETILELADDYVTFGYYN